MKSSDLEIVSRVVLILLHYVVLSVSGERVKTSEKS